MTKEEKLAGVLNKVSNDPKTLNTLQMTARIKKGLDEFFSSHYDCCCSSTRVYGAISLDDDLDLLIGANYGWTDSGPGYHFACKIVYYKAGTTFDDIHDYYDDNLCVPHDNNDEEFKCKWYNIACEKDTLSLAKKIVAEYNTIIDSGWTKNKISKKILNNIDANTDETAIIDLLLNELAKNS